MSFISILKRIGGVAVGVEHLAAPILETAFPALAGAIAGVDGIFQRLITGVATAELGNPLDGQGKLKAPVVAADFEAGLEITRQILAAQGKGITYDVQALQDAIAGQVAAFNNMAKVKASFKIVDLPK